MKVQFPAPHLASEEGVIAVGGTMTVENLIEAYSKGIFPWPHQGFPLLWFCPHERGIIRFEKFKAPKSLLKFSKKTKWQASWDKSFLEVIQFCAQVPRTGQTGTWITSELEKAYLKFHHAGFAHSLEVWEDGELIGGIYGVFVKNVFSAESMFFKRSNASKFALLKLVEKLKNAGVEWMDVQMLTSISETFGGEYISQNYFLELLKKSQQKSAILL
jgi:leucyl/phenylalanyl-tRNA--protein transferase